jgi:hypothetical protein
LPAAPLLGQKPPSMADEKKLVNNAQTRDTADSRRIRRSCT